MGRPGRMKSKGSEASTSQDDTPKSSRVVKRQGRPRKLHGNDDASQMGSSLGSRDSSPFSPANARSNVRRRTVRGDQLTALIADFDPDEDLRSHRLAHFLAEHPDSKEEYLKLIADRPSFPAWIAEKETLEFDGTIFSTGDVVCLFDEAEDVPYFAQIRALISDQFMRPFAWITWLAPRRSAPDPHVFEPEHFSHTLIDNKLYDLESLRWECARPAHSQYQAYNPHQALLDKHRKTQLQQRWIDLVRAAGCEQANGLDTIRAGDVKAAHTEKHKDDLEAALERSRERELERREEQQRRREEIERRNEKIEEEEETEEEDSDDEDEEEDEEDDQFTKLTTSLIDKQQRRHQSEEESDGEDEEEEEEETKGEFKEKKEDNAAVGGSSSDRVKCSRKTKRPRADSQSSSSSRDSDESAVSSEKPMEEDGEE